VPWPGRPAAHSARSVLISELEGVFCKKTCVKREVDADGLSVPLLDAGWLSVPLLDADWLSVPLLDADWLSVPLLDADWLSVPPSLSRCVLSPCPLWLRPLAEPLSVPAAVSGSGPLAEPLSAPAAVSQAEPLSAPAAVSPLTFHSR